MSFLRIGQYDGGDHEDAAQAFLKADAVVVEPDGQEEAEDGFHGIMSEAWASLVCCWAMFWAEKAKTVFSRTR